jgi:hypothetical protein
MPLMRHAILRIRQWLTRKPRPRGHTRHTWRPSLRASSRVEFFLLGRMQVPWPFAHAMWCPPDALWVAEDRERPRVQAARAGQRRFWLLSALCTHTNTPYKTDLLWRTLRPLKRPIGCGQSGRRGAQIDDVLSLVIADHVQCLERGYDVVRSVQRGFSTRFNGLGTGDEARRQAARAIHTHRIYVNAVIS